MLSFLLGFIFGIAVVLFILYVIFFDPWGPPAAPYRFIDQFPPIQIPPELKRFLRTGEDGQGVSRWESCSSLSLLLHMLYQEHKDSRGLRRWLYKRLQVELNDVITRTPMGRFVQDIRILDLSLGSKFPVVNNIRVEKVEMSEDRENFEKIHFVIDLEYTGNFETSIGIWFLGKEGHLSLKVTRLAGLIRLCLSRKPYTHWSFCFVAEPLFDFDVTSQLNGHSLKRLIPVITQSIKHTMRRKFVSPNYKIRYRPLFPHPLLQPSPPPGAFSHIKLEGGLEVTVLQCTRLNTTVVTSSTTSTADIQYEVYATVAIANRPFIQSSSSSASHSFTCILHYSRYDPNAPIGLNFDKNAFNHGLRAVKVCDVTEGSLADKARFKPGDILVAINNVPVRHERQVVRLMGTIGDLVILVERILDDGDDGGVEEDEVIIRCTTDDGPDSEFVVLGEGEMGREEEAVMVNEERRMKQRSCSAHSDSVARRHSLSQLPSSLAEETEASSLLPDSLSSSLHDIANIPSTSSFSAGIVQRTESARVPHVLVSHPSVEIRRTRSESQLNTSVSETKLSDEMLDEIFEKRVEKPIERASTAVDVRMEEMEGELRGFGERLVDELMERNGRDESTLTPGKSLEPASSSASIASSSKMDDESANQSENSSRFTRTRNGSKRQRLKDTISAGKRRMFDLMPSASKRRSQMIVDDVGVDALIDSLLQPDGTAETTRHSPSPCGNGSSKTPPGSDKSKRRDRSKNDSSVASSKGDTQSTPPSPSPSPFPSSLSTRPVHLTPDVIWGQSLHFALNPTSQATAVSKAPRFLNVTIHAREIRMKEGVEPAKPVLLGYTSLFIPQLLDDCQLTLSNAHREVFHLKPPSTSSVDGTASSPSLSSFAQHTGFDPRLCYGDVTLRFRYFPHGLPKGSGINPSCDQGEEEGVRMRDGDGSRNETPPPTLPIGHQWRAISCTRNSAICALCRGKIWTKAGTCCQKCLVVCHHKCAMKANSAICCTPTARSSGEDEELHKELFGETSTTKEVEKEKKGSPTASDTSSLKESPREDGENVSSIPIGEKTTQPVLYRGETEVVSRRARLRSKMSGVTEKWTHWRKKKNEKDGEGEKGEKGDDLDTCSARLSNASMTSSILSPIPIENELSDLLPSIEGSPHINEVYFQPGNAYNEETIANAKELGKTIFGGVEPGERRIRINEQIDRIRDAITETKTARLWAMQGGSTPAPSSLSYRLASLPFDALEQRMQALAVLMLHYCAALQDCNEESESDVISMRSRGEGEEKERRESSTPSISPTPSHAMEACEEVMVEP